MGLFDDTILVWGEFGRTIYSQGSLTKEKYGRDHHPSVMSIWLAGGGIRGGMTYGKSDDYSVNVVEKTACMYMTCTLHYFTSVWNRP